MNIRHAVIPAAGLGTRFLPITKSVPKELLPIGNIPALQYIVEEGIAAGINQFHIITSEKKPSLAHYFEKNNALREHLTDHNKMHYLDRVRDVIDNTHFSYLNQDSPRGLGHAISIADENITDDFFAVFLPDD